jgi:hypothetical protein
MKSKFFKTIIVYLLPLILCINCGEVSDGNFGDGVTQTWQKLYGEKGKKYGVFRAVSNGENGVYAGGYVDDTTAAIFNFDQYGTLKKEFTFPSYSGNVGPRSMGSTYNSFYSVLDDDNGYYILTSNNNSQKPDAVHTDYRKQTNNVVYNFNPRGILIGKESNFNYFYIGGKSYYAESGVYRTGISIIRHSSDGVFSKYSNFQPNFPGVTPGSYEIYGITQLSNYDILFYGNANKSGNDVAFACAVNINNNTYSLRWQKTYEIPGNAAFYNHFWDANNLLLLGDCDEGGFVVKIPGNTDDGTAEEGWFKTFAGNYAGFSAGLSTNDGFIFTGVINGINGKNDVWIVKTDKNGNKLWEKTYGGDGRDYANAVIEVSDGFIIPGSTQSAEIGGQRKAGLEDIYLLKINKDGTL